MRLMSLMVRRIRDRDGAARRRGGLYSDRDARRYHDHWPRHGARGSSRFEFAERFKSEDRKIRLKSFEAALDLYYLDNGSYPASNEGLKALVQRPASAATWNGPYLRARSVPTIPGITPMSTGFQGTIAPTKSPPTEGWGRRHTAHDQKRDAVKRRWTARRDSR